MEVVGASAAVAAGGGGVVAGAAAFERTAGPVASHSGSVVALLQKPSEELSLDEIEFLLNCVSKAPASPVPVIQVKPEPGASEDEGDVSG